MSVSVNVRITAIYAGWQELESKRRDGVPVLDFDLAPRLPESEKISFESREEVLREVAKVLAELEHLPERQFANKHFLQWKLLGTHSFLRKLIGEEISFQELLLDTMGIQSRRLRPEELLWLKEGLNNALAGAGINARGLTRAELQAQVFQPNVEIFTSALPLEAKSWIAAVRSALNLSISDPQYEIQISCEDTYWKNWISGNLGEPALLRVNTHSRNLFWKGDETICGAHEIAGHALQLTAIQAAALQGSVDPAALNSTVHTAEQFQFEGVAMTVAHLFRDERDDPSPFGWVSSWAGALTLGLLNEAQLMMMDGETLDGAVSYCLSHHPFAPKTQISGDLIERSTKPLMAVYQAVYFPAFATFMRLERAAPEVRWSILRKIYSGFYTPQQIEGMLTDAEVPLAF